jgi:hypothetical protein
MTTTDINTRIAALIAGSPAANLNLDRSGVPMFLLRDAALKVTMAQDDMNQQVQWLTSAVADANRRIAESRRPDSGNYGTRGTNLDVAIAKLAAMQDMFNTIAGTLAHTGA